MRLFFSILSLAYIAGIFLLADSPIVSSLAPFNPYSLLHIPLYGILTILLILSILPFKINLTGLTHRINQINQINQRNRFLVAGLIALGVAISDEIYQTYRPAREASMLDILLDTIGISLAIIFALKIHKKPNNPTNSINPKTQRR